MKAIMKDGSVQNVSPAWCPDPDLSYFALWASNSNVLLNGIGKPIPKDMVSRIIYDKSDLVKRVVLKY